MLLSTWSRGRRGLLLLGLGICLSGAPTGCHSHRIPNPTGPAQSKTKKTTGTTNQQGAADQGTETAQAAAKPQHNSYDKNGILKKKKYARRRLVHKNGQHDFLGIMW